MSTTARHYARWLELFGDAFRAASTEFPVQDVAMVINESMRASATSFTWIKGSSSWSEHWPPVVPPADIDEYLKDASSHDPLIRWHRIKGNMAPHTSDRAPRELAGLKHRYWRNVMASYGVERRLSVPILSCNAEVPTAFVACRDGRDFSDDDLLLASWVQPLLVALAEQTTIIRNLDLSPAAEAVLTGRQLAVLSLLADGLTAVSIARRLAISERTVHKHLQNTYAKLGASDRLVAVSRAHDLGILGGRRKGTPGGSGNSGRR